MWPKCSLLLVLLAAALPALPLRLELIPHPYSLPFAIAQVPGDGSCLFHALSACIIDALARHGLARHYPRDMFSLSDRLRTVAANAMESHLTRNSSIKSGDMWHVSSGVGPLDPSHLLHESARVLNLSPQEYCDQMRCD